MILNKDTIAHNFSKAVSSYESSASIQQYMGRTLIEGIKDLKADSVLEIGCGTGSFSELIMDTLKPSELWLNDLSEKMLEQCRKKFLHADNIHYLSGDAESIEFNREFSLIASNACFQWFTELRKALESFMELLKPEGRVVFSSFGNFNLAELKEVQGQGIDYLSYDELYGILASLGYEFSLKEEIKKVHYASVMDLLYSLKKTGVTLKTGKIWTRSMLKDLSGRYSERFADGDGIYASWHLYYAELRK